MSLALPSEPPAQSISRRLVDLARRDQRLNPYLASHLAEHVSGSGLWADIDNDVNLIDRLDPHALSEVLVRDKFGRGEMSAPS